MHRARLERTRLGLGKALLDLIELGSAGLGGWALLGSGELGRNELGWTWMASTHLGSAQMDCYQGGGCVRRG